MSIRRLAWSRSPARILAGALTLAAAAACSSEGADDADTSESNATAAFVPPDEPAVSSYANPGVGKATFVNLDRSKVKGEQAQRGLDDVLEGRGFHVAFPASAMKVVEGLGVAAELVNAVRGSNGRIDTSTADGRWQISGKLPSPAGRRVPSDTPLGTSLFTRNGVDLTNNNCFICHAGMVRGQVVAGLGNHDVDQTISLADLQKLVDHRIALEAAVAAHDGLTGLGELGDFFDNARGTIIPTYGYAQSRGDNMGPYAVWKRLSRLKDPAKLGLEENPFGVRSRYDDIFEKVRLTPVDPTPWWNRKYKKTSYAWAESSPHVAAHFAFNFTTPTAKVNELHEEHVEIIENILAFAEQTSSPAFPGKLDPDMVKLGAELFHGRQPIAAGKKLGCSGCHGTYAKKGDDYTKPSGWTVDFDQTEVVDIDTIKTDDAYAKIVRDLKELATRGNEMSVFFSNQKKPELAPHVTVPNKLGYVPQVLVGVWASAPYFHNGSVPTLYGVLNSSARPKAWSRPTTNAFAYSTVRVGIAYGDESNTDLAARAKRIEKQDIGSAERIAFRSIYDTTKEGRHNTGHTFGDAMNEGERFAVIEFLKSLSGEDMPPKR